LIAFVITFRARFYPSTFNKAIAFIIAAYRQVFISSAVYETQNPICLVHFVAMHEYISRTGNIAAIYSGQKLFISIKFLREKKREASPQSFSTYFEIHQGAAQKRNR